MRSFLRAIVAAGAFAAAPLAAAQDTPLPADDPSAQAREQAPAQGEGERAETETEEEREARAIREAQARLKQMEEMFLRTQLEQQLNELAEWDAEAGEVVLKAQDLGGLEIPVELFLEQVAEHAGYGKRLRIKKDVQVRPFALAIQNYMGRGGMDDVQRMQRGEVPFDQGVPDRVYLLVGDLLEALNDQVDDARRAEVEAARDAERKRMQDRLADRLGLERERVEVYGRILREIIRGAERRLETGGAPALLDGLRGFVDSRRGERLARRILEAESVRRSLESIEGGLDAFLGSDAGRELTARLEELLQTEQGRGLEEGVEGFLASPEGQRLLDRWEAFQRLRREAEPADEPGAQARPREERSGGRREGRREDRREERQSERRGEPSPF